jgi:hypothetical protein
MHGARPSGARISVAEIGVAGQHHDERLSRRFAIGRLGGLVAIVLRDVSPK